MVTHMVGEESKLSVAAFGISLLALGVSVAALYRTFRPELEFSSQRSQRFYRRTFKVTSNQYPISFEFTSFNETDLVDLIKHEFIKHALSHNSRVDPSAATPLLTTHMPECQSTLGDRSDFRVRLASLQDEAFLKVCQQPVCRMNHF